MSRINKYKVIVTASLICLSHIAFAQSVIDWVTDPTGTATNYVIGEASRQASNAWEGFLNEKIKNALSKDAQILADFPIDSTALDSIDNVFGLHTYGNGQFELIPERQAQLISSYVYCSSKKPIGLIGDGAIRRKIIEKIDSLHYPSHQISDFELLTHNHPEVSELYQLWKGTCIGDDATILYYWATMANRLDSLYPKKAVFPKPNELRMEKKDNRVSWITISNLKGKELGEISCSREIKVFDAVLLNMAAMSKTIYTVEKIKYKTDFLGRVISVSYQISNDSKRKSSIKGKVNASHILVTYDASKAYKPMELIPQKYEGSVGRLNIVPIEQTPANKEVQKALSKQIDLVYKTCKKQNKLAQITYNLKYSDRNECPDKVEANIDGERFALINNNASQLAQINFSYTKDMRALNYSKGWVSREEAPNAPSLEKLQTVNSGFIADKMALADLQKPKRIQNTKAVSKSTKRTNNSVSIQEEDDEDAIFVVVESMPEFPGGQQALFKYLCDNIKYPPIAQENGIQGRVVCQFVVNKDGSIVDVEVARSGGDPSLDKEAVRVIKSMPKWKPGKQRGKVVRVKYTVPVSFKLQ